MRRIDEVEWACIYVFEDGGILNVRTAKSSVSSINLLDGDSKEIPYVSRSALNNGIAQFVDTENLRFGYDGECCISIGSDTQTVFYQPYKFISGNNIKVVEGESINEFTATFYITVLREQIQTKFNWGGNGASLSRLKSLKILLPIDDAGNPDYKFMQEYVQQKRRCLLCRYKEYANEILCALGDPVEIPSLNEKEWSAYMLGEIAEIKSGHDIYGQERIEGNIPYITSGSKNNGIGYFIGNNNYAVTNNAISVNRNGSVGESYYHPYKAIYGNDCRIIILRDCRSSWAQLFLTQAISMQKETFSYSRKLGTARLSNLHVMLPKNDDGNPDYQYMEQYVKNLMIKKYSQYLKYIGDAV